MAVDALPETSAPVCFFLQFCAYTEHVVFPASPATDERAPVSLFIGLMPPGKPYIADELGNHRLLASNANSFTVASGFLVYTTTAHVVQLASLTALVALLKKVVDSEPVKDEDTTWETQRVERDSRIVTAVPSTMSLVLQMPRGDLETINLRPLVMEIIKQDIDR